MKFAFSTNAYRKYTIEQSILSINSAGYQAVELMCDIPHAFPPVSKKIVTLIKDTLRKKKMKISNLNGFMMSAIGDFHHPSWIEKNHLERQKRIDHTINCLKLAKDLGARTVSTEPGGPLNGISEKKGLELFKAGIDQVLPVAEKTRVKLLIEPEPELLLENSRQFLEFISQFDTKYLGLNFDIGHFYCVNEDPAELIISLKDYISHIHLEDISKTRVHKHLIPGTGSINFQSIFDALDIIDYKGFVTVELYPYQDDPEQAAKKTMKFLKSFNAS